MWYNYWDDRPHYKLHYLHLYDRWTRHCKHFGTNWRRTCSNSNCSGTLATMTGAAVANTVSTMTNIKLLLT